MSLKSLECSVVSVLCLTEHCFHLIPNYISVENSIIDFFVPYKSYFQVSKFYDQVYDSDENKWCLKEPSLIDSPTLQSCILIDEC